MARRGINEQGFLCINPLPEASLAPMYKAAKLDVLMEPEKAQAFRIKFHIGSGRDKESVFLEPGQTLRLRDTEAKEFKQRCSELGGICIPDNLSEVEEAYVTLDETVKAVRKRQAFYREYGMNMVTQLMSQASPPRHPKADLDQFRKDYHPYLINEERAKVLLKYLGKLTPQLEKAAAAFRDYQNEAVA